MPRKPSARALEKIEQEAQSLASIIVLPDHADGMMYAKACNHLTTLVGHEKRILAWFDEPIKALHGAWKIMTGRRGAVMTPLQRAITDQKKEIARYQEIREAEARVAEQQRVAALDQGGDFFDAPVPTVERHLEAALTAPQTPDKQAGIVSVDVWKWRVVDLSRVPSKFLVIDSDKVNKLVNAMKGEADIPGIEVYQDRQIRVVAPRPAPVASFEPEW
jgi:hypothetical protein